MLVIVRIQLKLATGTRKVSLWLQLNLATKLIRLWKWAGGDTWKFGSTDSEDWDANEDRGSADSACEASDSVGNWTRIHVTSWHLSVSPVS